jgi:hypothetical protein
MCGLLKDSNLTALRPIGAALRRLNLQARHDLHAAS